MQLKYRCRARISWGPSTVPTRFGFVPLRNKKAICPPRPHTVAPYRRLNRFLTRPLSCHCSFKYATVFLLRFRILILAKITRKAVQPAAVPVVHGFGFKPCVKALGKAILQQPFGPPNRCIWPWMDPKIQKGFVPGTPRRDLCSRKMLYYSISFHHCAAADCLQSQET